MTARPAPATRIPEALAILEFWLGDALTLGWPSANRGALWFGGGVALDQQITQTFGPLTREAAQGGLVTWENGAEDRLALVLLLDQFTRNVFRGQAAAFSGDARACALALDALAKGWDYHLPLAGQVFMAMPLMHAESLEVQEQAVAYFTALHDRSRKQYGDSVLGNLKSAREHRDVIARFGRFPHRNVALGRQSTAQESAHLQTGQRFGQ